MEGLLDSVRHLTRELRLQMLIIDSFVPAEYQVEHRDKCQVIHHHLLGVGGAACAVE